MQNRFFARMARASKVLQAIRCQSGLGRGEGAAPRAVAIAPYARPGYFIPSCCRKVWFPEDLAPKEGAGW